MTIAESETRQAHAKDVIALANELGEAFSRLTPVEMSVYLSRDIAHLIDLALCQSPDLAFLGKQRMDQIAANILEAKHIACRGELT